MGSTSPSRTPTFCELADVLLSSGEDAGTGPGARNIAVVLNGVEGARDMRPLGEDAEGDGGQDGPRGDARRPPRTSAIVFAFTDTTTALGMRFPQLGKLTRHMGSTGRSRVKSASASVTPLTMNRSDGLDELVNQERTRLGLLLEHEDRRLAAEGVPIRPRLQKVLDDLRASEPPRIQSLDWREDDATRTFRLVHDWYSARYGGQAVGEVGPVGRLPFVHRGAIFTMTIPLRLGNPPIDPVRMLKDMSEPMSSALTKSEVAGLGQLLLFGLHQFEPVESFLHSWMRVDPRPNFVELFTLAKSNLLDACDRTRERRFGEAAFSAQQAVEKGLKSVLLQRGSSEVELKRVGHKLTEALSACRLPQTEHDAVWKVCEAMRFGMGVRYGEIPIDAATAVRLVHGGAVALRTVSNFLPHHNR